MATEFDLIARHFTRPTPSAVLGIGDDAALLGLRPGLELAISTDMLVAGTHFLSDVDPARLGHKALAVNLSDLAAMGAAPRWALLSIALPAADEAWVAGLMRGFFALAEAHDVELVGGDTTRGPLALNVTILGEIEAGQALRRDAAQPGDAIWVSGDLGGAALGLKHRLGERTLPDPGACMDRLEMPTPRVALGRALRGVAHAAIDVSDGLLADLGHILERSGVGAEIVLAEVPGHPTLAGLDEATRRACALAGGDDYELCFTAPPGAATRLRQIAHSLKVPLTCIGRITPETGLRVLDPEGQPIRLEKAGYDHFG